MLHKHNDYQGISSFIGSKDPTEVEEYSKHFFIKAPQNERLSSALTTININKALFRLNSKLSIKEDVSMVKIKLNQMMGST